MITEIVMPKMGESINEGTILEWRKKVGDTIELDEILLEIGTDKVDSEIPSPCEGVIVEILAKTNDVIEVGKVIAKIDSEKKVNSKQSKDKKSVDNLKLDDSLKDKKHRIKDYGITNDLAWEVGLACGGNLKILINPLEDNDKIIFKTKSMIQKM